MKYLYEYAKFSDDKVSIKESTGIYVGVDNMNSNKRGIIKASYIPSSGNFTKFKAGDILVGNIRPYLKKIWLSDCEGIASPDVLVISPLNRKKSRFIYSALLDDRFFDYMMAGSKGSKMPRGDREHVMKYVIPNLKNMTNIGEFIYSLGKIIELNNAINNNLEQQMHLIFEDMMAKATNNKIKGEFIVAKNLTQVITGKEDASFSVSNGKYWFFTCSNTPLRCDEYAFNSSSVLIAGNGDFNVKHYSGKFNAYQRTYVLTPPKEYYALLYLAALYRINSFKKGSSGSIVKFITKSDVENIPVFIPHDSKYLDEINKLVIMQEQNMLENELLVQLRDWLLPMLMNGQATISD